MNKLATVSLVLSVIALVAAVSLGGNTEVVEKTIREVATGGPGGTDQYERYYFNNGLTEGGRVATSSTASTYTTVAGDFNNTPVYVDWTPNVNATVSISGTSTHAYVPNVGDVAQTYWRNASSTAASTLTFAAADGGVDIQHSDGGNLILNGLDFAKVTYIRESTNLVTVIVDEMTEGD